MIKREQCYPGTNVKVTSGLLTLECENGHKSWHLLPSDTCKKCGAKIISGNPSSYIKGKGDS